MRLVFFGLIFPVLAFALQEVDRQELWSKNLLKNGGFENGLGADSQKWTASGGVLSLVSSGSNLLRGNGSATWDSSAAAQTLSYSALAIPNGLKGTSGIGACKILTPSGTATHLLEVFDGTSVIKSTAVTSSTTPVYAYVAFTYPTSGNIVLRLKSVASNEPLVAIDNCYLGSADEILPVNHSRTFTSSTSWTPPVGVTDIQVCGCGGGGAGGGGGGGSTVSQVACTIVDQQGGGGGAGGGGAVYKCYPATITPSSPVAVVVGAGGTSGTAGHGGCQTTGGTLSTSGGAGGDGVDSSFGSLVFAGASGGTGGGRGTNSTGAGGTAGGSNYQNGFLGGNGGSGSVASTHGPSNGTAALKNVSFSGGAAGALAGSYAGGGGGGSPGGSGAGGGGGNGDATGTTTGNGQAGTSAAANTCAGGGGGGGIRSQSVTSFGGAGGAGGSGVITVTWSGPPE